MSAPAARSGQNPLARIVTDFAANPVAVFGAVLLLCILLLAVFAPLIAPQNPYDLAQLDVMDGWLPPGSPAPGGGTYWLGTDDQGRDMLSAIFYGLRISLGVGVLSTVFALIIGLTMGLAAAYLGGRVETLIMRIVDIQLSFPAILIALILIAVLGQGIGKVIAALVTIQWAYYARTVRSAALVEKRKEYIEAARCLALSPVRIVFRHLLPNCLPPLIVVATVQVAAAIALEATLSFLGLGLPITEPSLGLLIANGDQYLLSGKYWISFFPGIALLLTIVSINLVADELRDVLSPRLSIMYLGRVVEAGPAGGIFAAPRHPYTQALLKEVGKVAPGKRTFVPVAGEIPSPLDPPPGCHFHPRCPQVLPRCRVEAPVLRECAPERRCACHLDDAAGVRAAAGGPSASEARLP
jgi:peptide/nickel transport system permease protein